MIVFCGNKVDGNFALEVAEKRNLDIEFVAENSDVNLQVNDVMFLNEKGISDIIIKVDQYINEAVEILDAIDSLKLSSGANIILLVVTDNVNNVIIREALARGYKNFINEALNNTDLKDELEKNLTGFYDKNKRKDIELIKKAQEEEKLQLENFKTIGVAGSINRIGTTTQAIQIAMYLKLQGYKVCLCEINNNKYINTGQDRRIKPYQSYVEKLTSFYKVEKEDKDLGFIKYKINMYYKPNKLADIIKDDYDYIIFDYGFYKDPNFNQAAFLKDDLRIFVCGESPTELDVTCSLLSNITYNQNANFIFSFTSEGDREEILSLLYDLNSYNNKFYFADYTPNPFVLSNFKLYEELLNVENKKENKKKKFSLKKIMR